MTQTWIPTESEPLRRERFCKSTGEEVAASGLGVFTRFAAEGFIDKKDSDRATRAEAESMNLLHHKSSGLVRILENLEFDPQFLDFSHR